MTFTVMAVLYNLWIYTDFEIMGKNLDLQRKRPHTRQISNDRCCLTGCKFITGCWCCFFLHFLMLMFSFLCNVRTPSACKLCSDWGRHETVQSRHSRPSLGPRRSCLDVHAVSGRVQTGIPSSPLPRMWQGMTTDNATFTRFTRMIFS